MLGLQSERAGRRGGVGGGEEGQVNGRRIGRGCVTPEWECVSFLSLFF